MSLFRRPEPTSDLDDQRSVIEHLRGEVGELRRAAEGPQEWLKRVSARKVLIHQTNDHSIEGLLVGVFDDGILLRSAAMLRSGADATPMGGDVFIPREKVALVQTDY